MTTSSTKKSASANDVRTTSFEGLAAQATKTAKDVLYVGVGFGVLAFQQAQNRRHELVGAFEKNGLPTVRKGLDAGKTQLERLSELLDRPITELEDAAVAVEAKVDAVLDTVQAKLPDPAATALGQLRATAKVASTTVRERVRTSA